LGRSTSSALRKKKNFLRGKWILPDGVRAEIHLQGRPICLKKVGKPGKGQYENPEMSEARESPEKHFVPYQAPGKKLSAKSEKGGGMGGRRGGGEESTWAIPRKSALPSWPRRLRRILSTNRRSKKKSMFGRVRGHCKVVSWNSHRVGRMEEVWRRGGARGSLNKEARKIEKRENLSMGFVGTSDEHKPDGRRGECLDSFEASLGGGGTSITQRLRTIRKLKG